MKRSQILILIVALIGTLFSGYLTLTKLFSGTCSLTEGCTYFLGYPTCLFGFIFFTILLILSLISFKKNIIKPIMLISIIAIIFSGYFTILDLQQWTGNYSLGIPSCIYGLFMFIIILISSIIARKK